MLQRSISSGDRPRGGNPRKAQDMAVIREVHKNRQSKLQKPPKPEKSQKIKHEKVERRQRRQTMSAASDSGGTLTDPVVIDD